MLKLPECDRCHFNARDPHLVCSVHPSGPGGNSCLDFRPSLSAPTEETELWTPDGMAWYDGDLVVQPRSHMTSSDRLRLIDYHPLFTGTCPDCGHEFSRTNPPIHWDCPDCGWMDEYTSP